MTDTLAVLPALLCGGLIWLGVLFAGIAFGTGLQSWREAEQERRTCVRRRCAEEGAS